MVKESPGWTYVLLEGYCHFHLYSSKKKVKVYSYENNNFRNGKEIEKIVDNNNYLPKHHLKRPKECPRFPGSHCLKLDCKFFAWCDGYFNDITHEMIRNYRRRDKKRKKSDIEPLYTNLETDKRKVKKKK